METNHLKAFTVCAKAIAELKEPDQRKVFGALHALFDSTPPAYEPDSSDFASADYSKPVRVG